MLVPLEGGWGNRFYCITLTDYLTWHSIHKFSWNENNFHSERLRKETKIQLSICELCFWKLDFYSKLGLLFFSINVQGSNKEFHCAELRRSQRHLQMRRKWIFKARQEENKGNSVKWRQAEMAPVIYPRTGDEFQWGLILIYLKGQAL